MMNFDYVCFSCGIVSSFEQGNLCSECGQPQSLRPKDLPQPGFLKDPPGTMWHYLPLIPVEDQKHIVTLQEGATPLIEAETLNENLGIGRVLLKNESLNPTGSFKDRQVSVGMSHARELGADTVAVVSSGNVAASTSAYAARAGMRAVLLMHGQAGATKIAQASAYGATVVQVASPKPSEVFDLCLEACREWGWYHLSTAGIYEPFNVEGSKTIAYEIYQQTAGDLPDWVIAPVGGGGLLGGVWRGFLDLKHLGLISKTPKMVGVQASGCAPLVEAIERGWSFAESREHPWPNPQTIAGGIADDILFDGHTAIPAIRESGGQAVSVTDTEMLDGLHQLASNEGIFCEICSATTIAAISKLDGLTENSTVCCLITGNGIKDLETLSLDPGNVTRIPRSLKDLELSIQGQV